MQPQKYVLMLDGGFVRKKLKTQHNRYATAEDIEQFCREIQATPELEQHHLLRIYYYDARPTNDIITHPITKTKRDLGSGKFAETCRKRLQKLELLPNFAVRLGVTRCTGWELGHAALRRLTDPKRSNDVESRDFVPNISQKGVDMRIGLDISQIAIKKLADMLVLVTGDSDIIPAMKMARKEGLLVYLHSMNHGVYRELKVHADRVL